MHDNLSKMIPDDSTIKLQKQKQNYSENTKTKYRFLRNGYK